MHNIYTKIIAGIHKYFKQSGVEKAVIGISGGLDSAVALKLTVDALSKENVTAIMMPEKGVSLDENIVHAKLLCDFLNVEHYTVNINKFLTDYLTLPWKPNTLAQINSKTRLRMAMLYSFANTRNALVVGTANKTDLQIGFVTKYGDLAADIHVLGDLFKEDVYKLAEHLGLPDEMISKTPTGELYIGQTDEDEVGLNHKEIESVLVQIEKGTSKDEMINKGINPNTVQKVLRLVKQNEHKLRTPLIIEATTKTL